MNKILLSGMDEESLNRFFASEQFIPYTANTITYEKKLRSQLKEKGFAITESEYERQERDHHPQWRSIPKDRTFCVCGYYASTVGLNEEVIKESTGFLNDRRSHDR